MNEKLIEQLKGKDFTRSFTVEVINDLNQDSEIIEFALSSETPVERNFGSEILEHSEYAIDFSRLEAGVMPLLYNHDPDKHLGKVISGYLDRDTKKFRVKAKFSKRPTAQEFLSDVRDGILTNVSVGYTIENIVEQQPGVYRVTRWTPIEASLVTIPASIDVGIGRSRETPTNISNNLINIPIKDMSNKTIDNPTEMTETTNLETRMQADLEQAKKQAAESERERIASITALCQRHNFSELAVDMIQNGTSIQDARTRILDKIGEQAKQSPVHTSNQPLGLSKKEERNYSILKAVNAYMTGDWSKAGLEREIDQEIAKRNGKAANGFYVPLRDLTVRTPYQVLDGSNPQLGGTLVDTDFRVQDFIELMRNRLLAVRLGITTLTGLQGNIEIPKQLTGSAYYWLDGEFAEPPETNATFGRVGLSPKTIGSRSVISRYTLLQSSIDIENFVRQDLAIAIAEGIDTAILYGTGTNGQPKGIFNSVGDGVQTIAMGTNGGELSYETLIEMETLVAEKNLDTLANYAYLTSPRVRGKLKTTTMHSSITDSINYLWTEGVEQGFGVLNGYRAGISNQLRTNRTKGTGSNLCDLVFGSWSSVIMGEWGSFQLDPNPYGQAFGYGGIELRALMSVDLEIRYPASFVIVTDASVAP